MSARRTSAVRGRLVVPEIATTSRSLTGPAREDDGVDPSARVSVNKAYKMFVGGAFVRSESGRYVQSHGEAVDAVAELVGDELVVRLRTPQRGVAPGQTLVLYRPDPGGDAGLRRGQRPQLLHIVTGGEDVVAAEQNHRGNVVAFPQFGGCGGDLAVDLPGHRVGGRSR